MSLKIVASLMTQRRFLPLWLAQTQGAFNDNLFRYALVALATYQGWTVFGLDNAVMVPLAATAFTVPIFAFSAIAGQVADRYDRTRIMRIAKFAEIILMMMAAVGFLFQLPFALLLTLFLMGVQSTFFLPARNSALPSLMEPHELVPANAALSGAINVAILSGAIGGTLLIGPDWGVPLISALLVVMAVLGWIAMRQQSPAPGGNPDLKVRWGLLGVLWETPRMLGHAVRAPDVLRPLMGVAWFWMLAAAVITVLPLFTRDVLGADEGVVAVFQLIFTIGAALGAVICGSLSKSGDALRFSLIGALMLTVFPLDIALYTLNRAPGAELINAADFLADRDNWRILFDLTVSAVGGGLFLVPLQAMAQRRAKAEMRGRLLAASGVLNGLGGTLGPLVLLVIGALSAPLQTAFACVALGSFGAVIFIAGRMLARRKTLQ